MRVAAFEAGFFALFLPRLIPASPCITVMQRVKPRVHGCTSHHQAEGLAFASPRAATPQRHPHAHRAASTVATRRVLFFTLFFTCKIRGNYLPYNNLRDQHAFHILQPSVLIGPVPRAICPKTKKI